MATRLDRLFVLLDTGSTPLIRKSAAEQLGTVQRLHPHELHNLLEKVLVYLRSPSWDTRVAAGQALSAICANVTPWRPDGVKDDNDASACPPPGLLSFSEFDLEKVLSHGASLLGSEGREYETSTVADRDLDPRSRLVRQREQLNKRLGLSLGGAGGPLGGAGGGLSLGELVEEEDFKVEVEKSTEIKSDPLSLVEQQTLGTRLDEGTGMSARERNRAKRKAKMMSKKGTMDPKNGDAEDLEPPYKRQRSRTPSEAGGSEYSLVTDEADWPFQTFCAALTADLFHASWTVRHGAATGLRDVIKHHGNGAGRSQDMMISQMCESNAAWLADMSLRLICVMALDRFGDFVSDEVVAPVRESCAQALGSVVHCMSGDRVRSVLTVLLSLFSNQSWEARHGALLGIKYLLAIRKDLTASLLPAALPSVLQVLADSDDDVRAVAAASLVSVVSDLTTNLPQQVPSIVTSLWDTLLDLDDLTASTNSVMALLAALLGTIQATRETDTEVCQSVEHLMTLVPRLWPFLRHSIVSVRASALQTLLSVIDANSPQVTVLWLGPLLHDALRHLFQRALLEADSNVREIVEKVWRRVVDVSPVELLIAVPWPSLWLCLLMQPSSTPYDRNLLVDAQHRVKEPSDVVKPCRRDHVAREAAAEYIGGQDPHDRERNATRARIAGAGLVAYFCRKASLPLNQSHCSNHNGAMTSSTLGDVKSTTSDQVIKTEDVTSCDGAKIAQHDPRQAANDENQIKDFQVKNESGQTDSKAEVKSEQPDVETFRQVFCGLLLFHLNSNSGLQRMVCYLVIREWALLEEDCVEPAVRARLTTLLTESTLYDELAVLVARTRTECQDLIACLNQRGADVGKVFTLGPPPGIAVDQAQLLVTSVFDQVLQRVPKRFHQYFQERRGQVASSVQTMAREQRLLALRVSAALAGCVVTLKCLPPKMNPIIRPIMDTIKTEDDPRLQALAAENLSRVLSLCICREPCPNPKVVKNLCSFLVREPCSGEQIAGSCEPIAWTESSLRSGIISLHFLRHPGGQKRRGPAAAAVKKGPAVTSSDIPCDISDDVEASTRRTQHRGARLALETLMRHFGAEVKTELSALWDAMFDFLSRDLKMPQRFKEPVKSSTEKTLSEKSTVVAKETGIVASTKVAMETCEDDSESVASRDRQSPELFEDVTWSAEDLEMAEVLSLGLQVLAICAPHLDRKLHWKLTELLPRLTSCLRHPHALVRHRAAWCVSVLVRVMTSSTVHYVIRHVVPMLGESDDVTARSGAVEVLHFLMSESGPGLLPYLSVLVSPLLGRMSDQYEPVRQVAALSFATLVQLLPLEAGTTCPPDLPIDLAEARSRDRKFVDQLLHPDEIQPCTLPVKIDAELRTYQQEGVNWLHFLNTYRLHGILCDDMGLGKSLQSICILATDLHHRRREYKESGRADARPLPSLIVCPSTLIQHWILEVEKFVSRDVLKAAAYSGLPQERKRLQSRLDKYDVIVASYEIVRNDIDFFGSVHWNYCILDEGHVIKNTKAKITKAIKQLDCNHRLILTGTPIQNNVVELWSLFDFLMPGFLGTERQFTARFARPIQQSRDAKSTSKEQEAGALAMERLHGQVLPFILRRLKEDVLHDLPPKIIQDYQCELSKLQVDLYEDFTSSQDLSLEGQTDIKKHGHVFQAIQYLRKVCVHPALVLTPKHPQYAKFSQRLLAQQSSLDDIQHSSKLVALKQLLLDCGIGASSDGSGENEPVVNQHRVLIFCQLKAMLDIIEKQLFKAHMKTVTYCRLDGSVPADSRMKVVHKFNSDPSIDVLLLTTHVGGLGLNLTGADTVIFVEHDWNPMRDLQAMDRAHRIGQKKVVNVYRLISRGTLEEKIMGLQKFKMSVANTVVSQDNSSMDSMATGQVLDLFTLGAENKDSESSTRKDTGKQTMKSVLEGLEELWGESQYAEEYELDQFVASLPKT